MPMGLRGPSGPKKIIKLIFRELAFLHRKLRDCGLGVVYILNGGATLLVGTSISLNRLRAVSLFLVRRRKRTRHENDYARGVAWRGCKSTNRNSFGLKTLGNSSKEEPLK